MKRIRYIEELNYFNAAACLLVILIHVLSLGIVSLNPATWQGFCIFMPWRISQFVVPAFLFSGAVKMSLTFPDRHEMSEMKNDLCRRRPSYKGYLMERCRTILLPYAVFILIYYFIYAAEGLVQPGWSTLLRGFATGDISGHFYYIIIIIQFYLLKPVWEKMLNYVPWQAGMAASLLIQIAASAGFKIFSPLPADYPYQDRFFVLYLFFWTAGIYAGRYYEQISSFLRDHRTFVFACGCAVVLSALTMYVQHVQGRYLPMMDSLKIAIDSLSILTLLSICIAVKKTRRLKTVLEKISRSSYQVYLSHCLFVTMATVWLQRAGIFRTDYLLVCRMAVGYTLPFALYFLTVKVKKRAGQNDIRRVEDEI